MLNDFIVTLLKVATFLVHLLAIGLCSRAIADLVTIVKVDEIHRFDLTFATSIVRGTLRFRGELLRILGRAHFEQVDKATVDLVLRKLFHFNLKG